MKSTEQLPTRDPIGSILIVVLIMLTANWITYKVMIITHILFTIVGLIVVIVYYLRVVKLPLEIRTPLGDTLVVLAGIDISLFFLSKININNFISDIAKEFTPSIGLALLVSGIIVKLFLIDTVIRELIEKTSISFNNLYLWIIKDKRNFIRGMLFMIGLLLYLNRDKIDEQLEINYTALISLLLFGLIFLISALNSWTTGEKHRIRVIILIIGIWFLIAPINYVAELSDFGARLLGLSIMIWSISIPTILNFGIEIFGIIKKLTINVTKGVKSFFRWLLFIFQEYNILILRFGSALIGVSLIINELFYKSKNPIIIGLGGVLLLPLFFPIMYRWLSRLIQFITTIVVNFYYYAKTFLRNLYKWIIIHQILSLQITTFIIGLAILVYGPDNTIELINYSVNLNKVFGILFIVLSFVPTLIPRLKILLPRLYSTIVYYFSRLSDLIVSIITSIYKTIQQLFTWIQQNLLFSLRIGSALLSVIFYNYGPKSNSLNLIGALTFLFLAFLPTIIAIIRFILPSILNLIISIRIYFQEITRISGWGGFALLFTSVFISNSNIKLVAVILAAIFLSLGWNYLVMRIIEYFVFVIISTLIVFKKLILYVIQRLTISNFISTLAWIFLGISIFFRAFFKEVQYEFTIRFLLFFSSIIIWNLAYDYRRKRFYRFINRVTVGFLQFAKSFILSLWNILTDSIRKIIQNILIILAWIIALFLFYLSFGLIFHGTIGLVSVLFPGVSEDRLVSSIIGISLIGIAILSIQQSFVRRETLQIMEDKQK